MRFSILTLFPDVVDSYVSASIIGRARAQNVITVDVVNIRDYTDDPHKKVDDSPYGGGSGMVLRCQPVEAAFESLKPLAEPTRVLMTSPAGRTFDHTMALELKQAGQVVILCGHYEGFDARLMELLHNVEEVSIGDFVLTGGELPALCILDSVTRLIPGAVQKFSSVEADSFYNGLLDYPHYTRPEEYKGLKVPDVLLSGNHAKIAEWRHQQALDKTQRCRPDLLGNN